MILDTTTWLRWRLISSSTACPVLRSEATGDSRIVLLESGEQQACFKPPHIVGKTTFSDSLWVISQGQIWAECSLEDYLVTSDFWRVSLHRYSPRSWPCGFQGMNHLCVWLCCCILPHLPSLIPQGVFKKLTEKCMLCNQKKCIF